MTRVEGQRLSVTGPATLATAPRLLEEARAALVAGVTEIDLGEVTDVDSSLLAVIFAWMREARAHGRALVLRRVPRDLASLARLYGVAELLPEEAAR